MILESGINLRRMVDLIRENKMNRNMIKLLLKLGILVINNFYGSWN